MSREEGGAFRIEGEIFKEGEDVMDIFQRVVARDQEISRYPEAPGYDGSNYIPDRQV